MGHRARIPHGQFLHDILGMVVGGLCTLRGLILTRFSMYFVQTRTLFELGSGGPVTLCL